MCEHILRHLRRGRAEDMKIRFGNRTVKRLEDEIDTAHRLNNLRLFKIVKCLLLVSQNTHRSEVARLLHVSERTVYNWTSRFILEGFSWLLGNHYKGRGRKSKLTKGQKDILYNIVTKGPEAYGFDCGLWTSAMIAEVILQEFGVSYNSRYLCSLLKKLNITYQKVAFEPDRSEDNEKQRQEWVRVTGPKILKEAREKGAVILFEDEVSFAQWGSLARTWAPRGKQPKVKTAGKRKGLKMFGAIEFFGGAFHYMETPEKFNGASYIEFLQQLLKHYSTPVILIEDGASYHRSAIVKQFKEEMASSNRLFVYRLPSYSPDYNPIEKLWKNTKRDATHCKYFKTFDDLRASVINAFNQYTEDAGKVICVMKKMRTSAGVA
jgi:transposase